MLSALLLGAAINAAQSPSATKACPDGSVVRQSDHCLTLPDHRSQFSLPPSSMTLAAEWSCGKFGKPSEAKVRIRDKPFVNARGEQLGKVTFVIELLSLRVSGAQATEAGRQEVQTALQSFDKISILQGVCFQAQPALFLKGYKWDGNRHEEVTTTVEL